MSDRKKCAFFICSHVPYNQLKTDLRLERQLVCRYCTNSYFKFFCEMPILILYLHVAIYQKNQFVYFSRSLNVAINLNVKYTVHSLGMHDMVVCSMRSVWACQE
jgi:hypothetical protein